MGFRDSLRACGAWLLLAGAAHASDFQDRFLELRESEDRVRIAEARGLDARELRAIQQRLLADFRKLPPRDTPEPAMRLIDAHLGQADAAQPPAAPCGAAPPQSGAPALQRVLYACYSEAAARLVVDGLPRDRLSILHEIATSEDPARREHLFRALEPLYQSVTGDGSAANPYRELQARIAAAWARGDSPIARNLAVLNLPAGQLEPWLVAILEAWRAMNPGQDIEPWDYEYAGNPLERRLGARVPRERFEQINAAYHASLGADPVALNIHFDLAPRAGKTVIAFTDFGARPRQLSDGSWSHGEPWVFASYSSGGIGNLNELLHETGHAIHIAAIRTAPAYADWPDSDALTEAIAEIFSQEIYEVEWQQRWLGAAAPLADNLKSRYSGVVLDVAWGLFELRVYADPSRDPNEVWTGITGRYLRVRPHADMAWWARRGQLVDSPGDMMNYALGAILAADLRARARELRGSPARPDAGYYAWIGDRLLRFGREKPSSAVVRDFLGRAPDPGALLADMRRR